MSAPVQVGPSPSSGGPVPYNDVLEYTATIGDRIRTEREARGWSRSEMGHRACTSADAVKRLEEGNAWLPLLVKGCRALGVSVDYLLSDRWEVPQVQPTLAPRQAEVLAAAASGEALTRVGAGLGVSSQAVASMLSKIYVRLGVAGLPVDERRGAAVRVAERYGLLDR